MADSNPPKEPSGDVPQDALKDATQASASRPTASPAPSFSSGSGPYIPQFTAATQMILKRIKGEPSSLSAALSQASKSPAVTSSIPSATFEDVRRRLVMGMNTSTQMTMQLPAASPVVRSSSSVLVPTPTMPPKSQAMSAIRKVTSGQAGSTKSTPTKAVVAKAPVSDKKIKKPKPAAARSLANKHRRLKGSGEDDESASSQSGTETDGHLPATESATPTPPVPLTMTKSGRQVLKPDSYNPVAMDAAVKKKVHYGKRTVEQALCRKCSRMHSPATNQMVFCDGCNEGWHQYCHDPFVPDHVVRDLSKAWYCVECSAKRDKHVSKKQRTDLPRPKESWASKSIQQKRAYLSTLSQQELVGLLMTSLELHPDLPIFPASVVDTGTASQGGVPRSIFGSTTTEGLFHRSEANPTGTISYVRKVQANGGRGASGKGGRGSGGKVQKEESYERTIHAGDEESDPLTVLWPKPGMGLYSRLPHDTEDSQHLADDDDYEAFSVIIFDDRGRKLEENGMKV